MTAVARTAKYRASAVGNTSNLKASMPAVVAGAAALASQSARAHWLVNRRTAQRRRARELKPENSVNDLAEARSAQELAQLQQRIAALEKLSATDYLTGVWNRAHMDHVIDGELERSARLRQPLSLMLLDIDHFKTINDTYGHQAGDEVLRELVGVTRAGIRNADLLFRWGGEEFAVLATSTGYRNTSVLAEVLRCKIEQHCFPHVGALTVSIGVAEHSASETADAWFRRADQALYLAKGGGRNRVVVDSCGNSDAWAAQTGKCALHLVWQEAYECGNATIDGEHRRLFELANAAIDASFLVGTAPELFCAALDALLAHAALHFSDEEALLEECGYERLRPHKAAHQHLLAKALVLKAGAEAGTVTLGSLVNFLANDLVAHHLFTMDRDFFPLFGAR